MRASELTDRIYEQRPHSGHAVPLARAIWGSDVQRQHRRGSAQTSADFGAGRDLLMQPAIPLHKSLPLQAAPVAPMAGAQKPSERFGFLEIFILAQVVLPAILFLPGTQPLRVLIRIAPFALSLFGL